MCSGYEIFVVVESSQIADRRIKIHRAVSVVIVGGLRFSRQVSAKRRDAKIRRSPDGPGCRGDRLRAMRVVLRDRGAGKFSRLVVCGSPLAKRSE